MFSSQRLSGQYAPVSTDLEGAFLHSHAPKRRLATLSTRVRPLVIIFAFFIVGCFLFLRNSPASGSVWDTDDLHLDGYPKPKYIDVPPEKPAVIRLAIICRVDEFERRQVFRESMLQGLSERDVHLSYKFFVGKPVTPEEEAKATIAMVEKENQLHDDIVYLKDVKDIPERLSEKRFAALKWSASVPHSEYDWFLTIDSDTFCRFRTLVQRIQWVYPAINPREQSAMIGRMGEHLVYFENTVADGNEDDKEEDSIMNGKWYPYPLGIGYLLSSNLTATILSANPAVPHHINYPSDDVMIGSWVAALKYFHDPNVKFETRDDYNPPVRPVYPKPYLSYPVDTIIVDDKIGWHDFKNRGTWEQPVTWETACVHRMSPAQQKVFRKLEAVKHEWDSP